MVRFTMPSLCSQRNAVAENARVHSLSAYDHPKVQKWCRDEKKDGRRWENEGMAQRQGATEMPVGGGGNRGTL